MLIYVKTLDGALHQLEVEFSDTIESIKNRLSDLLQVPYNRQHLIYAGKQLEDRRTISDYGVGREATLDLVVRRRGFSSTTYPSESVLPDRVAAKASIQAWKTKAQQGGFEDDVYILDPQAYYTELAYLEQDVVQASRYFEDRGRYGTSLDYLISTMDQDSAEIHMSIIPDWMTRIQEIQLEFARRSSQQILDSLLSSYIILCRVLTSFDSLQATNFCHSYYSILLERSEEVAEIVKIYRHTLENVKIGIETATAQICDDDIHHGMIHNHLVECVEEPCSQLLKALQLPVSESVRSSTEILDLCLRLSLMADLGLVSYVGSHATRFDKKYLDQDTSYIAGDSGDSHSFYFDCQTRSLACLNGFLDEEHVWVFRCSLNKLPPPHLTPSSHRGLLILTHIEEFADIWGPVWSIPAGKGQPGSIRHYNVSKGAICRVDEAATQKGKPIRCHWYRWSSFQIRRANRLLSLAKPLYLEHDDLLLIGTRFRVNFNCSYTLDQFETDFGHEMGVLGGERSVWESDLDSRSGSISFSKIFGVSVSGTQKRRPQTSLKQLILARWKTAPQTANPGILNQYLGLEISHCTGNAQRVRIKDLLLIPSLQLVLDLQFPRWSSLPWGVDFLAALLSDDPEDIFKVWKTHQANRPEMAAIICYVLEILDKTGRRDDGIAAAFLNNRQEFSVTFDDRLNDWSSLLRDSHLMATYAIVTGVCIECHTPDHSTATCDSDEAAYTVLETRLGLANTLTSDLVRVQPSGQICKTLERLDFMALRMMPVSGVAMAGAYLSREPVVSGVEIRDAAAKGGQQYRIFLRASNTSYGGMKKARTRLQTRTQPSQAWLTLGRAENRVSDASSASIPFEPPRSASAIRLANRDRVSSNAIARLQASNLHAERDVQDPQVRGVVSNQAMQYIEAPSGIASDPNSNPQRNPVSAYNELSPGLIQRAQSQSPNVANAGDSLTALAPDQTISNRSSNRYTISSAMAINNNDNVVVHAANDIAVHPSLTEDIANYQIDDFEESYRETGLLHDINNYQFDEDFEEDPAPNATQWGATHLPDPSTSYISNPTGTDMSVSSCVAPTANSEPPTTVNVANLTTTSSEGSHGVPRQGKKARFYDKLWKMGRKSERHVQ